MSWFGIAESLLPSTRSKIIAALSIALVPTIYALFTDLPASWLPKSDSEKYLVRLLVTETTAFLGLLTTFLSVIYDFNAKPSLKKAIDEADNRLRQNAIDDLSEELSWAIHYLLNKQVSSDDDLAKWEIEFKKWCNKVSEMLNNRKYFTKSDQLHFDRLGLVPPANYAGSFNKRHEWLVSQLNLKFERLRDIIKN